MKKFLASFPQWTFSVLWIIIVAWLMVVPTKFMESLSDMVRDIDNWCHFLLTAVMVMLLCFDWQRKHKYQLLKMPGLALF